MFRKLRIVLFLFGMEPKILEEQDLTGLQLLRGLFDSGTDTIVDKKYPVVLYLRLSDCCAFVPGYCIVR
jgi:hypothetical protein